MRHHILPTVLCILLCACAHKRGPERVQFFEGDLAEAMAAARAQNKLVYVDAVTMWCGPCKRMDREALADGDVARFVHERFVPVKISMDEKDTYPLRLRYRVNVFPTHLVFDGEGRLLFRETGWRDASGFVRMLENSLDPTRQLRPGDAADAHVSFPAFLTHAFARGDPPADSVLNAWLDAQEDWLDELSWTILYWYRGGEEVRRFIVDNRAALEVRYGQSEVESKLGMLVHQQVNEAILRNDEAYLDSTLTWLRQESDTRPESIMGSPRLFRLRFYEETKRWKSLVAFLQEDIDDTHGGFDAGTLNNAAYLMYRECDDPACLAWAVRTMKSVSVKEPRWQFIDTYAHLLHKTGQRKEATRQAQRAMHLAVEAGDDPEASRVLLEKLENEKSKAH